MRLSPVRSESGLERFAETLLSSDGDPGTAWYVVRSLTYGTSFHRVAPLKPIANPANDPEFQASPKPALERIFAEHNRWPRAPDRRLPYGSYPDSKSVVLRQKMLEGADLGA